MENFYIFILITHSGGMMTIAIAFLKLHQTSSWSESLITVPVRDWKSLYFKVTQQASCMLSPSPWYGNLRFTRVHHVVCKLCSSVPCDVLQTHLCWHKDFSMLITYAVSWRILYNCKWMFLLNLSYRHLKLLGWCISFLYLLKSKINS